MNTPKTVKFCYDIVCPFAYMASTRIEQAVAAAGGTVEWMPVLLGGLYDLSKEPQGKANSATKAMIPVKAAWAAQDVARQAARHGVSLGSHPRHPLRTLKAQRLLAATPNDGGARARLTRDLYRAYWVEHEDLDEEEVLARFAAAHGQDIAVIHRDETKERLRLNTEWASERGAWGVPTMFVGEDMFWGGDRIHFVQRALGMRDPPRLRLVPTPPASPRPVLRFYFDFASPWTALAFWQVERVARECNTKVEYHPILLGAVFKAVGQENLPMATLSERKRAYVSKDMNDWSNYCGEKIVWPDVFPIRTVLPLRVFIVEPRAADTLFRAAWQRNQNIGDEAVLVSVLNASGFDGERLVQAASAPEVKDKLKHSTASAVEAGVFGAPTFQVGEGGPLVFGQDRLDMVADLLCGWDMSSQPLSRL